MLVLGQSSLSYTAKQLLNVKRIRRKFLTRLFENSDATHSSAVNRLSTSMERTAYERLQHTEQLEDSGLLHRTKLQTPVPVLENDSCSSAHRNSGTYSKSVVLFPGEGSQHVGMGRNLADVPSAEEMFQTASAILNYDLKRLCLKGPAEELDKTVHAQPAVLVTSLAALQKLKRDHPQAVENCISTAGYGVGEYAALVLAGAISFESAVHVVNARAKAMQAASELSPGGMLKVVLNNNSRINYACLLAKEWCRNMGIKKPHCQVASQISHNCKVIAGNVEALQFIEMNCHGFGIARMQRNYVDGAFHTVLMLPAEPALRSAVNKVEIKTPSMTVYSNVDGSAYASAEHVRKGLVHQISLPVKWEHILNQLCVRKNKQLPKFYECGPGTTLTRMMFKHHRHASESMEHI